MQKKKLRMTHHPPLRFLDDCNVNVQRADMDEVGNTTTWARIYGSSYQKDWCTGIWHLEYHWFYYPMGQTYTSTVQKRRGAPFRRMSVDPVLNNQLDDFLLKKK